MASQPKWLTDYYGSDFDWLNPTVVQEGKTWAIVKLMKPASSGSPHSSIGHVLIRKTGRHIATPHISLHEGIPQVEDLKKMQDRLAKEEENSKGG